VRDDGARGPVNGAETAGPCGPAVRGEAGSSAAHREQTHFRAWRRIGDAGSRDTATPGKQPARKAAAVESWRFSEEPAPSADTGGRRFDHPGPPAFPRAAPRCTALPHRCVAAAGRGPRRAGVELRPSPPHHACLSHRPASGDPP